MSLQEENRQRGGIMSLQEELDAIRQELARRADHICYAGCQEQGVDHEKINRNLWSGEWFWLEPDEATTFVFYMSGPDPELAALSNRFDELNERIDNGEEA